MGAGISFENHVHIAKKTLDKGALKFVGYMDITQETIDAIAADSRIKWVQISEELPREAYSVIDGILERRPDLYFRIFHIYGDIKFDLSVLELMPHLERVRIDAHLRDNKDAVNVEKLCELTDLKGLHLDLFDRRDYSFMKELSGSLEELVLNIDTMSGSGNFDCEWLLRYPQIRSLWLGKHAKKHLERVAELPRLKSLSLRGIGVKDLSFPEKAELERFGLLYCKNDDLSGLGRLKTLRELELWRIIGLGNIDFIKELDKLEVLKLQDLKHVTALPDLSGLAYLREIVLDNVPIDVSALDESVRRLVRYV